MDCDGFPEHLLCNELSCPRAESLLPLGRIDAGKANALRLAIVRHFDRVPIYDSDYLCRKIRRQRGKRHGNCRNRQRH